MMPPLGLIEGFFGRSWSWDERRYVARMIAAAGYSWYHYAPKADARLRRRWQELYPATELAELADFAAYCRGLGLRFGVGLTPFGSHETFGSAEQAAMRAKLAQLAEVGLDDLAVLFDDMRGDFPDLAQRQAAVFDCAAAAGIAAHLFLCPSYYSDDPVLDRVFGLRPDDYLGDLGRALDPAVQVYWTGPEVCSKSISPGHLRNVAERLGRLPCLWDNYPVNDGVRMSRFLHLRGFSGRGAEIAPLISGHAVNPALQPHLGCIPLLTLPQSYRDAHSYCYSTSWIDAATQLAGADLAEALRDNLLTLQETGLDRLSPETVERLRGRYAALDGPFGAEVVAWLDGGYGFTGEEVQTQ